MASTTNPLVSGPAVPDWAAKAADEKGWKNDNGVVRLAGEPDVLDDERYRLRHPIDNQLVARVFGPDKSFREKAKKLEKDGDFYGLLELLRVRLGRKNGSLLTLPGFSVAFEQSSVPIAVREPMAKRSFWTSWERGYWNHKKRHFCVPTDDVDAVVFQFLSSYAPVAFAACYRDIPYADWVKAWENVDAAGRKEFLDRIADRVDVMPVDDGKWSFVWVDCNGRYRSPTYGMLGTFPIPTDTRWHAHIDGSYVFADSLAIMLLDANVVTTQKLRTPCGQIDMLMTRDVGPFPDNCSKSYVRLSNVVSAYDESLDTMAPLTTSLKKYFDKRFWTVPPQHVLPQVAELRKNTWQSWYSF